MSRTVIGVVGPMVCGKGVLVSRFEENGFTSFSLSNILREGLDLIDLPRDREVMQDFGDFLREHGGNAVLADRVSAQLLRFRSGEFVVESIRNPSEIHVLRKFFDAKIIAIDASMEKRWGLTEKRNRPGDPTTWEEFLVVAERDLGNGQENFGQNVRGCMDLADITITNEGTLRDFEGEIGVLMTTLGIEGQPPTKEIK